MVKTFGKFAKVKPFFILSVVIAIFLLAACSSSSSGDTSSGGNNQQGDGDKKKIGFSNYNMQYGYFQVMEKGTKDAVEAAGFDYVMHDQKGDEALMVSGSQDLINQRVDALIISPIKPGALGPIVQSAHEKNIPVVINDVGGGNSDYDALIISDNYGGGQIAGEFAIENLKDSNGSKEVAIIKLPASHEYPNKRSAAFKKTVTDAGYKVVKELAGQTPEDAYKIMKDILTSNPNLEAVFIETDTMGVAAAQAIVDAKRQDIIAISFDGDEAGLQAVKEGTLTATIKQKPYEMGQMAVEIADKLIKGEKLQFDNEEKREIHVDVTLVTKDNVEEVLKEIK